MTDKKLTPRQIKLLRAVADGQVDHLGAFYFMRGRRKVSARMSRICELGLVDPWGVAVPPDKRCVRLRRRLWSSTAGPWRFADYHRVTLTAAGLRALDAALRDAGPDEPAKQPDPTELAADAARVVRRQEAAARRSPPRCGPKGVRSAPPATSGHRSPRPGRCAGTSDRNPGGARCPANPKPDRSGNPVPKPSRATTTCCCVGRCPPSPPTTASSDSRCGSPRRRSGRR